MAVYAQEIDARSLRRIALLVMRAKQDCGTRECPELRDISQVIERMKRNVALGSPFSSRDVHRMVALVRQLDNDGNGCHMRFGILDELRDLVQLPKTA